MSPTWAANLSSYDARSVEPAARLDRPLLPGDGMRRKRVEEHGEDAAHRRQRPLLGDAVRGRDDRRRRRACGGEPGREDEGGHVPLPDQALRHGPLDAEGRRQRAARGGRRSGRDHRRGHRRQRLLADRGRRRSADRHHVPGRGRPRRSGRAPQCLPDRADRSRDGLSLRRVPHPQGPQDRPGRRRLVLRTRRLEGSQASLSRSTRTRLRSG